MRPALGLMALLGACELLPLDDQQFREDTPSNCVDGIDNDGDGLVDCADPDCQGLGVCAACGNGRVDREESCDTAIAAGQPGACPSTCDDGDPCTDDALVGDGTCSAHCAHTPAATCCGNGRLDPGESCDDGNRKDFDGCSHDCHLERTLALESLALLPADSGCDLDGDGDIDNSLGVAFNASVRNFLSDYITRRLLHSNPHVALLLMVGDDPLMQQAWRGAFLAGLDTDLPPDPTDNFSGQEPFWIEPINVDIEGHPLLVIEGSAPAGAFDTRIGAFSIPIPNGGGYAHQQLWRATLHGQLTVDTDGPSGLTARLCGGESATSFYQTPNDAPVGGATALDLLVVGVDYFSLHAMPVQPDLDIDGDGLERFVDSDGDQQVDLCIDGNGAQIVGRDCPMDPRIADAYSVAYTFSFVRARLAGAH